ncbi:MAG: hypothetical protein C4554_03830 [Dethiobacter sp.]|nr:MAG: hypothetical protein C4554_03830 [Dethiobacter sp.]
METYRLKLQVNGGFISPFQADTIFGGLCWVMRYSEGNGSLQRMLDDFCCGKPWFVLSNAYPGDLLPKPLIKIRKAPPVTRDEHLWQAREGKRIKKIGYLTPQEFYSLVSGKDGPINNKEKPISQVSTLHNQINRIYGSTAEGGHLFEQVEYYINPESYLSVYVKLNNPALREWLFRLFRILGETGLGKRKSTGKGSFSIINMEKYDLFESIERPNAFLSLSNFVPAPHDPVEGYYKIFVKYGKLGEDYALSDYYFKQPLLMIQAGSVFFEKNNVKPFYGQMVENIAPSYPEALHYALAFSVPVRLER